jgi:dTDP-4-dehydrorhamnose 3,5-epimerase
MQFTPTEIPDVLLITPRIFRDDRGAFMETYRSAEFAQAGIPAFVQENLSLSRRGVLRGLHYQVIQPQGKLVRPAVGAIYDVAVDLRRSSPTFGRWVGVRLEAEMYQQLWVPAGFAHGFYALSEWVELVYKTTDYYAPAGERTLRWDDPDLAIPWPLADGEQPLVSPKDAQGYRFKDLGVENLFA